MWIHVLNSKSSPWAFVCAKCVPFLVGGASCFMKWWISIFTNIIEHMNMATSYELLLNNVLAVSSRRNEKNEICCRDGPYRIKMHIQHMPQLVICLVLVGCVRCLSITAGSGWRCPRLDLFGFFWVAGTGYLFGADLSFLVRASRWHIIIVRFH